MYLSLIKSFQEHIKFHVLFQHNVSHHWVWRVVTSVMTISQQVLLSTVTTLDPNMDGKHLYLFLHHVYFEAKKCALNLFTGTVTQRNYVGPLHSLRGINKIYCVPRQYVVKQKPLRILWLSRDPPFSHVPILSCINNVIVYVESDKRLLQMELVVYDQVFTKRHSFLC